MSIQSPLGAEKPKTPVLSVVVPAYNEAQVLPEFHRRLSVVLQEMPISTEVWYVDDGSQDETPALLRDFAANNAGCGWIRLSRNFGKEIAMTAGLDHAQGDAVVFIDADLQDPPEVIPELVVEWCNGGDVVFAKRRSRVADSWLKRFTAWLFYRLMRRLSDVEIPVDAGDFRLLSRRAADAMRELREQHRFMKGLFAWVGFDQRAVEYDRAVRGGGQSKWGGWRLWNLAIEGITAHTTIPLRLSAYVGLVAAFLAFLFALWMIYEKLVYGNPVPGYPSLMVTILFIGGVQMITLGIIGEYLGRMFHETKRRPLYLVSDACIPRDSKQKSRSV